MPAAIMEQEATGFQALPVPESPAWLADVRDAARARFEKLGFPTLRDEEWRFTDPRPIGRLTFAAPPSTAPALTAEALQARLLDPEALRLVFCDGRFCPGLSQTGDLPAGVTVGSLAEAAARGDETVKAHLGRYAPEDHAFAAHNGASFTDGAFIGLAKDAVLETPIEVVFWATAPVEGPICIQPRNLFVLGRNSRATVIESYVGPEGAVYLTNAVTEVRVDDGAALDHIKLQRESEDAFHVAAWAGHVEKDARLESLNIQLGAALARNDWTGSLDAPGVHARFDGVVIAGGDRLIDNHTSIDHRKPHGNSFEVYKTILGGRARGVFNGKIVVQEDAQKTDAKQTNRTLLLTETAVINTKPQLEIFADDVKCTHGATIGQLDDEALYYLRARGLSEQSARRLLTYAFAAELVEGIQHEPARTGLRSLLMEALDRLLEESGEG